MGGNIGREHTQILQVARERLGITMFRPGQEEAIASVLAGRDTLAVMPTGSGKSAIYQVSAVLLPGPTVVISPLIALQQDQAGALADQDVGGAARVNSAVRVTERNGAFEHLEDGTLEFIFLAPEQLHKADVLDRLREAKPSLFVVDEAHCISEWGHDFRPDYLRLGQVIQALDHPAVLALTATASHLVRGEIIERLGMHDPKVIVRGFDRPNIWLGVQSCKSAQAKQKALLEMVAGAQMPGIVYVATRRHAEEIADTLADTGVNAVGYHGGMKTKEREAIQEDFMSGRADVIVATSAFGMGVDKQNVRFVFHYDVSDSLDAYYQEVGRAGRDGNEARAMLFYRPQDLNLHKFFAGGGKISAKQLAEVAAAVHEGEAADAEVLRAKTALSHGKLMKAVNRLQEAGAVRSLPTGEVVPAENISDIKQAAQEAERAQERRHAHVLLKLERMRAYAELRDCRRQYLLEYFGEEIGPCGFCDNCQKGLPLRQVRGSDEKPFPLKTRVVHRQWGKGIVRAYDGGNITVLFDEMGEKTLSLDFVLEHSLLQQAG